MKYEGTGTVEAGKANCFIEVKADSPKGEEIKVFCDGVELKNIIGISLNIKPHEFITATVQLLVNKVSLPVKELKLDAFSNEQKV